MAMTSLNSSLVRACEIFPALDKALAGGFPVVLFGHVDADGADVLQVLLPGQPSLYDPYTCKMTDSEI
jgi:hypothetical protein